MIRELMFRLTGRDVSAGRTIDRTRDRLARIDGAVRGVRDRFREMGRSARDAGSIAAAGAAVAMAPFRSAFRDFDEQVRAQAKVRTAIQRTGGAARLTAGQLFEAASGLQAVTRFGDEAILNKVTAQLLTFPAIAGDIFLRAQRSALDLATVLDGDVQSAALMLGKALGSPAEGLTALTRAGVVFTQQQKDQVKALVEAGDVLGAQRLILEEIEGIYAGQAEAAAAVGTGPFQQLANLWGDFREIVGSVLVDVLRPAIPVVRSLIEGLSDMPRPLLRVLVIVPPLTLALGGLVATAGLLVAGLAAVSVPVAAVVAGIAAATAAVVAFLPEIAGAARYLRGAFVDAAEAAGEALGRLRDWFETDVRAIATDFADVWGEMWDWIAARADRAYEALPKGVRDFLTVTANVFGVALVEIEKLWDGFWARISGTAAERGGMAGALAGADLSAIFDPDTLPPGPVTLPELVVTPPDDDDPDPFRAPRRPGGGRARTAERELARTRKVFEFTLSEISAKTREATAALAEAGAGLVSGLVRGLRQGVPLLEAAGNAIVQSMERLADRLIDGALRRLEEGLLRALEPAGAIPGIQPAVGQSAAGGSSILGIVGSLVGGLFSGAAGFNTGGRVRVGGIAGIDRNLVPIRASRGETIEVRRPDQQGGPVVNVTIQTPDVDGFRRSRGQVARDLAAAVAAGQRMA